jgi:hypothetical protein
MDDIIVEPSQYFNTFRRTGINQKQPGLANG